LACADARDKCKPEFVKTYLIRFFGFGFGWLEIKIEKVENAFTASFFDVIIEFRTNKNRSRLENLKRF
jgi:hypothetical protein